MHCSYNGRVSNCSNVGMVGCEKGCGEARICAVLTGSGEGSASSEVLEGQRNRCELGLGLIRSIRFLIVISLDYDVANGRSPATIVIIVPSPR